MDTPSADSLCDQLTALVTEGPGDVPGALAKVNAILREFDAIASDDSYLREKVITARSNCEAWFSPRKWKNDGEDGARLRRTLLTDIANLRKAVGTRDARKSAQSTRH
jgi:hypothetical protein